MKYPKEWPGCAFTDFYNFEYVIEIVDPEGDGLFRFRYVEGAPKNLAQYCPGDLDRVGVSEYTKPLTPAAEAMLAIARER